MVDDPSRSTDGPRSAHRRELLERTVHDLKNPLAVVRATLEWLEVELADRADALDAVHDATTAAARLVTIVEDLDTIARLETGQTITSAPVELAVIVGAVTAAANTRLATRRITVASTVPSVLETKGDTALLTRSLDALVDVCARGATGGSCIEIMVRTVPSAGSDGAPSTEAIEIVVGLRGVEGTAPPVASIASLASGGLGAYLALRVFEGHGGSLMVVPTATVPRVLALLPR